MEKLNDNCGFSKNQNIKIVPSLEETLISKGLDVDVLDESLLQWLAQLKYTWKTWKKSATVENHINCLFCSTPDPFRIALIFVTKCEEFNDCKPKSLPYFIVEILHKFSQTQQVEPDETLKVPAFHIAIHQRNQNFLGLMCSVYKLSTAKVEIIPTVKEMIKNDNCKLASQIIIAMQLFDAIPVEELLFPLLLQDKGKLIDDYFCECPTQTRPFVLFLDTLLDKKFNLLDYVQSYAEKNNVHQIKPDKLHYKPLGKIVARLCNKYSIPIETCKNLSKNRTTSGLRYMVYQRYVERKVSTTVWDDLVKDSLRQSEGSGPEFIQLLADYDKTEALKWAKYLNILDSDLPVCLQASHQNTEYEAEEECWDTPNTENSVNYYKCSLTMDKIEIIDSGEKFYELISCVTKKTVVSLDCEWKPSFGAKQSQVALIQLGTDDKVYLIDTILLNKPEFSSFWHSFYKSFLENAEIIKLGFGLEQDLKEMKTIVAMSNLKVRGEGLLDLSLLWKSLLNHGLSLPDSSDSGGSLSSLVQSCFGLPLEKSEQCSNWELRPLRETQIKYAATDAHVLIKIYNYLQNKCLEQGINFEELCNDVMGESKKKVTKKPKVIERIQQSILPLFESRSVSNVKFFVESSLTNLMPYLRYCGIDTIGIPTTMLWHDVIYRAISEERFMLLSKPKMTPNTNYPQSSILSLGKSPVFEQLNKILNTYNISIQHNDLLGICLYCNGKDLKKVSKEEVSQICHKYTGATETTATCTKYVPDNYREPEELDFGDFLSDSEGEDDTDLRHAIQPAIRHKPPTTTKGIPIVIDDLNNLSISEEPSLLCDDCGKLYSNNDILIKTVRDTVFRVTKLT